MTRLIFAVMAGIGCFLLGQKLAHGLERRHLTLAAWMRALQRLQAGVGYDSTPLAEQFARVATWDSAADAIVAGALTHAAQAMREDPMMSLVEAFRPQDTAFAAVSESDRAILLPALTSLGAVDREQQGRMLQGTVEALSLQHAQAAEKAQRDKRLYATLGGLGGLALFLCLL